MALRESIQTAIIAALKADGSVSAKTTRIYDLYRPGKQGTLPKILVGYISEAEPAEHLGGLQIMMYQISVFTASRDMMEAVEIGQLIKNALHSHVLTITGWKCHWIRQEGSRPVGIDETDVAHYAADYMIAVTATT